MITRLGVGGWGGQEEQLCLSCWGGGCSLLEFMPWGLMDDYGESLSPYWGWGWGGNSGLNVFFPVYSHSVYSYAQ